MHLLKLIKSHIFRVEHLLVQVIFFNTMGKNNTNSQFSAITLQDLS